MKIKHLHIQNYKSLVDLKIVEPNAFSVFAGPNGAGKSNIFEVLEFMSYSNKIDWDTVESLFGGQKRFVNFNSSKTEYKIELKFDDFESCLSYKPVNVEQQFKAFASLKYGFYSDDMGIHGDKVPSNEYTQQCYSNFTRIFINKEELNRVKVTSNQRLLSDTSNLSPIIKNILSDSANNEEFIEWLKLFIPGFENLEVQSDIDGNDRFHLFEKGTQKPFDKKLISDGTYNILALLAAVYQSNEPQFLCIEEPENGLNPYVIKTLVDFFRKQCEEKGHYIWLNTHSQTLVKELQPHELILVDKVNGATQIKQFSKDYNLHGLTMDEAWLSNALGGGLPW